MKTLRYGFMTLLVAVTFIAGTITGPTISTAGDPNQLTIIGATPQQETIIREVTAWPWVPPLDRPVTVILCETCWNMAGANGMTLGSVLVADIPELGYVFLHEYGHIWDYHFLSADDRQAISNLHDIQYPWYGATYNQRPAERFAATFAQITMANAGYQTTSAWVSLSPPFTDIGDQPQETQDAILWLYSQGITKGTSMTTYSPDDPVTRGQMALFLQRALTGA